jgi:myo-inositol 2-dehydrogenase/D-chiro-inositol 1-dehydrogenase
MHVGMVGVGRIGSLHAQTLKESQLVSRLTVVDADQKRAASLAESLRAEQAASVEALTREGVDALVIAAATPVHAELLHLAADARVPAFCEKPIALDLASTDAVIEHVQKSGTFVQIGFQRRFDAGYQAARKAVLTGALGDVHMIRLATHDPAPPPEDYLEASGGIWLDLAIHDFDIGSWVLGRPIVEVFADGVAHSSMFERHGDVDAACATLKFEGGTLGVVTAMRNDPRGYDVRMEVFGLRDSVAVGWDARTPLRSLEPGMDPPSEPGYENFIVRFAPAYRAEIHGFLDAVQAGAESPCTVFDARQALAVGLGAGRSLREQRPVRIQEIG